MTNRINIRTHRQFVIYYKITRYIVIYAGILKVFKLLGFKIQFLIK